MFGTYRLLLALAVMLSHYGMIEAGFHPGQWAVVSFYFLSGFLMEKQFTKITSKSGLKGFYLDRFLRVYPLFFVSILIIYLIGEYNVKELLLNLGLFPVGYGKLGVVRTMNTPTWSLATEAHFYLLMPLLASWTSRNLKVLTFISIGFFCVSVKLQPTSFWAYYFFGSVLFTFLSGILLARGEGKFLAQLVVLFAVLAMIGIFCKYEKWNYPVGIHINLAIGYVIAGIMIPLLAKFPHQFGLDHQLGKFSYPLFLFHDVISHYFHNHDKIVMLSAWSIVAAVLGYFLVEKPFDTLRYSLRKKSTAARS